MRDERLVPVVIGTFAAALFGAFAAFEFDRITEVLARAFTASGRAAAIQMASMMILGGVAASATVWLAAWFAVRAASAPYDAIADRLEQLAIGDLKIAVPVAARAAGVRRLGLAVLAVRNRLAGQERELADLQARNDLLFSNSAEDHRMLLGMVAGRGGPFPHLPPRPAPGRGDGERPGGFNLPEGPDEELQPEYDEMFDAGRSSVSDRADPIVVRRQPEPQRITGLDSWSAFSLNATWRGPEVLQRRRTSASGR
ncbi:hypothetical protein [Brevundimonas sp.]|uniref:hypothetical protein n=1 Tax=Brevundimonas sp. TaxID=1871086 RepID=UPI002FC77891